MIVTTTTSYTHSLFSPTSSSSSSAPHERSSAGRLASRSGGYSAVGEAELTNGDAGGGQSAGNRTSESLQNSSSTLADVGAQSLRGTDNDDTDDEDDMTRAEGERSRMFVRALYDYSTDDPTSLSFSCGDVIQVLKQLDSGWWDGIVGNQRGWFPSNYCTLLPPEHLNGDSNLPSDDSETGEDDDSYDEYDTGSNSSDSERGLSSPGLPMEGTNLKKDGTVGYWVPQATPTGRLFYFNTHTGESRAELPLESPTSTTETGPQNKSKIAMPEQTQPPPDMLAQGYERDEPPYRMNKSDDEDSASDRENELIILTGNEGVIGDNQSAMSERTSTTLVASTINYSGHSPSNSVSITKQRVNNFLGSPKFRQAVNDWEFCPDKSPMPETWDELVEKTSIAVERFRHVINKSQLNKYTKRAEEIADWLRLVIACGSLTTDYHTLLPPTLSRHKELNPHFRHFMAAFSKLILSSSVAAAEDGAPGTEMKCLAEADEVLVGVFAYADLAKRLGGEKLPRVKPGFIQSTTLVKGWRLSNRNQFSLRSPKSPNSPGSPMVPHSPKLGEHDVDANTLDSGLVEAMEKMDGIIKPAISNLEGILNCDLPVITTYEQHRIGTTVITSAYKVFEVLKRYMALIRDIKVTPQILSSPSFVDFAQHRQRLTDSIADLMMACQKLSAPLADEWTARRGETMEEKINWTKHLLREVAGGIRSLNFTTQLLVGEPETQGTVNIRTDDWRGKSTQTPTSDSAKRGLPVGSKAGRILGAEPPQEMPKYLMCDHDTEILYGQKGQVKGGTIVALVERLTRHDMLDSNFNTTFLITYPSFITAMELFNQLVRRFTLQPPPGIRGLDYERWVEKKQRLVRMRVLSILKVWLESNWMEDVSEESKLVLKRMHHFAKEVMLPVLPGTSQVLSLIETRIRGQEPENKRLVLTMSSQPPPPLLPRNMRKLRFLDVDPLEFARQLTIIEARSYAKLKVVECLSKGWSKQPTAGAPDPAQNIRAIITQSNQLTNWVAEMILTQPEPRKRVLVIKHFIAVAEKCRSLNNFSTLTAILAALQTASIHRLKRTWEHVPQRAVMTLEGLSKLMGATMNFMEYREMLHIVNPPCVPFLGVYLKDLTFVADGNEDFIRDSELINFGKRVKASNIISEIQQYQAVPYPLQPVPELQEYILSNMQTARDVNEMYSVSLSLEPREREDEKIARLLQESGFL